MSARRVVLAGLSSGSAERACEALREAGFEVASVDAPEPLLGLASHDEHPQLVIVDEAFGPEGGVAVCRRLREDARWRTVSLMLVVPAGEQRLEECLVSGINDFILEPFPVDELLDKAERLTVVPQRRDLNTLARLRDPRLQGGTLLGKTLNVSLNGLLVEVETSLPVGRFIEVEFFLPDDSDPLRVTGRVIRRAQELDVYHPAYGLRFEEMSDHDRDRIDTFIAKRERAVSPPPEAT